MGFLSKLFGGKTTVTALQKAVEQKRYADAHYLAEELNHKTLEETEAQTVASLAVEAGDGLARLNLIEAQSKQHNGERDLAEQHFALALEYAKSPELKEKIEQARQAPVEIISDTASVSTSGCGTCAPVASTFVTDAENYAVDEATRLELVLSSYPSALKQRYLDRGRAFVEGFLASQEGDSVQSYELFKKVEDADRDDIYWFEVGSVLARMGKMSEAKDALERALEQNPQMMLAVEALVEVLLSEEQADHAVDLLQQKIEQQADAAPQCYALLVTVYARQQDWKAAKEYVQTTLDGGHHDPAFISLAALVMEKNGHLDEAEALYAKLPTGGGCRGNINLQLAEFHLRNNRNLEKAFAAFNAAVRQEPESPRWILRLAQTCFARQWPKEGLQLLAQLLNYPRLDPDMKKLAQDLMVEHGSGDVNSR